MEVISLHERKEGYLVYTKETVEYLQAQEKQYAKEVGKELQKGYMKLLSAYNKL